MSKKIIAGAAALLAALAGVSACGGSGSSNSSNHSKPPTINSAQDVADALKQHGMAVTTPVKDPHQGELATLGAVGYDVVIKPSKNATTDYPTGINIFKDHADLTAWIALSNAFGGVAVTGDK